MLLSEISRSVGLFSVVCKSKQASISREQLILIIMSLKRKRSVLSIEDKQSIILQLEKGEKGTNLSAEYGVSKQQISDIRKNKEKIMKFADNLETSEGLKRKSLKVAHDEQLDNALYAWFIQQRTSGTPISGPLLQEKAKHFLQPASHRSRRWRLQSFDRIVGEIQNLSWN